MLKGAFNQGLKGAFYQGLKGAFNQGLKGAFYRVLNGDVNKRLKGAFYQGLKRAFNQIVITEMKRLSIDPQIKSAHCRYRDSSIGIMSIQQKRTQISLYLKI